jgi:hypothetical protein
VTYKAFRELAKVNFVRVVEFQARGLIHVHAVMRLDGPDGPASPPGVDVDAVALGAAVEEAAAAVRLEVHPAGVEPVALRWGAQLDTRVINLGAVRDAATGEVHPEMVAAYLAKYLTKSTEDFGLDGHGRIHSAVDARYLGARPHAVRIIETAEHLAATAGERYERLADRFGTLGYRGHPVTKTRRYSTTFGALRQARKHWRRYPAQRSEGGGPVRELDADSDGDPGSDETDIVIERNWRYVGSGFLDAEQAALALTAAAMAREHRR